MNDAELLVKGIISYLTKAKKMDLIPEIIDRLKALSISESNIAEVISAYDLSENEKEKINGIINLKFGKVSDIKFITEKKILGGIIIKYKDKMMDLSLSGKLQKIEESVK